MEDPGFDDCLESEERRRRRPLRLRPLPIGPVFVCVDDELPMPILEGVVVVVVVDVAVLATPRKASYFDLFETEPCWSSWMGSMAERY
jgi:hypothetical protein